MCWHHSGGGLVGSGSPQQVEIETVRMLQNYCMDERGFCDIDYYGLIGPLTGSIYEGRGDGLPTVVEAAQLGTWNGLPANDSLLGVCFMGNYALPGATLPAIAQQGAMELIWYSAVELHRFGQGGTISSHVSHNAVPGGTPTACPGDAVRAWVQTKLHGKIS